MRIDTASRRKNSNRAQKERTVHGFEQWLRGRPCLLANHPQGGCGLMPNRVPVEFAHVDCAGYAGGKGGGLKVHSSYGLPLCPRHHDEQHGQIGSFRQRGGWKTFQLKYGFDAVQAARDYWMKWPGRRLWEAKQEAAE